jgi:hypothetical protein
MFIYTNYKNVSSLKTLEHVESWIKQHDAYYYIEPSQSNALSMGEAIESLKSRRIVGYGFIVRATVKCDALTKLVRAQSVPADTIYIINCKRRPFAGIEVEVEKEIKI